MIRVATPEIDEAELEGLREAGRDAFNGYLASLIFRPIAEYDRDRGDAVILGDGKAQEWAPGYWGTFPEWSKLRSVDDDRPAWRHAQDWQEGQLLEFEPVEFAEFGSDEWRTNLLSD